MEEESYFFKLSKYQDRLLEYIEDHPDVHPAGDPHATRCINFLTTGTGGSVRFPHHLQLGHPVSPSDPKHVVYVWLDALSNYITAHGLRQR